MKNKLWLTMILSSCIAHQAHSAEVLVNGNFETGNISGWTATSTQNTSFQSSLNDGKNSQVVSGGGSGGPVWYIRNQSTNYFGVPATPIAGYSAFNSFDGDPGVFTLKQSFSISNAISTASLLFSFATQSSYSNLDRTFDVNILNSTGASILANVYHYILPKSNTVWSINNISLDIASQLNTLGIGTYQLAFQETIPQSYTGPALFAIDNISLNITDRASVPEPATIALMGLGFASMGYMRRRKSQA